jgi:hypothetical protein
MILKLENKKIELYSVWYEYLYPYLVRFTIRNKIRDQWKNDFITIPIEYQEEFNKMLENVLDELLEECYIEPNQRQRTRHPGAFQKIEFKEKLYVLNYRTDIVGIIGYGLHYLITCCIKA